MIALNRALYEVWSLRLWCSNLLKIFSLLLHKNTKNSSMHVCNGCWAEIEDHAYITRCGHQFCASSFLFYTTVYALLKFFCFSSLVLSSFCRSLVFFFFFFFLRIFYFKPRRFLLAHKQQVKRTYRECRVQASAQSGKKQCSNDT